MFLAGLLWAALAVAPWVQRDFGGTESSLCPTALPAQGKRAALFLRKADYHDDLLDGKSQCPPPGVAQTLHLFGGDNLSPLKMRVTPSI